MSENELTRLRSLYEYEEDYYSEGIKCVAGIDEAGRGPLAGPVVAAAVILPRLSDDTQFEEFSGLNDSKKLSEKKRDILFNVLNAHPLVCAGIGIVSEQIIDRINILRATQMAMRKAVSNLSAIPDLLLIDGMNLPGVKITQKKIIDGDALSLSIAAASVIAKVTRDSIMRQYHEKYPQYEFDKHKGYGTKDHMEKLKQFGPCKIHRKSFGPILLMEEIGINDQI